MSTAIPAAICVPVRNEERLVAALIAALAGLDRRGVALAVFLHLDSCTDGTEQVVRAAAASLPFALSVACGDGLAAPNAGRARRAAMALGLAHASAPGGILLTTDADSRPAPDWLQATVAALGVADVAAGRIERCGGPADPIQSRLEAYYDRLHRYRRTMDPVPWEAGETHHFSGGANLAFRTDAYRAIGGFSAIPSGEDATALDEAARTGLRVRRDRAMLVRTSSRRHGRAPGGLAAALRAIDVGGLPLVAHPAAAAWQYGAQAQARAAFARIDSAGVREALGRAIALSADHVLGVARDCANAEAFAMRIVPAAPFGDQSVPLPEAELALAELERELCDKAA